MVRRTLKVVLPLISLLSCSPHTSTNQIADKLVEERKFNQAIALYQEHIQERLSQTNRAEWENPYFYLIKIGDIKLLQERPDLALKYYLDSETKAVSKELIVDRILGLAKWYEDRKNIPAAVELLKAHRERDPLLINGILDRLVRSVPVLSAETTARPAN